MNIFYLDHDPRRAAHMHCDKHVVKMCLETAQILSTALHSRNRWTEEMYRPTHVHHPCVRWAGESWANYNWTWRLLAGLLEEYRYRYGRVHATTRLLEPLRAPPGFFPNGAIERTPPAQAMPEQYRREDDPVTAYRLYYLMDKTDLLVYTRREVPGWIKWGAVA